ncbi:Rrf2 family transcriptional regulator [Lelliottia aquatilis]|uniref:Rrf2 family transcriptional regulator n=1 Tax=Lelliottia aquatilis TaxID=2080838 RepID=UPI0015774CB0|nr:Rrf2 family transcriptional regulator [Lelliottia aquatilis]NTZ48380.1 Rrf2 family transcriptional regulator [Lelliottia aquatilis]
MKVSIESNGEVIWYLDTEKQEGMTSLAYIADGTQGKIISSLEGALHQANGEMLCGDPAGVCSPALQI